MFRVAFVTQWLSNMHSSSHPHEVCTSLGYTELQCALFSFAFIFSGTVLGAACFLLLQSGGFSGMIGSTQMASFSRISLFFAYRAD